MGKYVIVGGVAGGATAAARLRRLDEQAEIVLIERGSYISFANCGLPYYIGNVIKDKNRLLVQTKEQFQERFRVDVRIKSEAIAVNTEQKTITIRSDGKAYEETYDALLLSPGARPVRPAIHGIDDKRIMTLRSIPDAEVLRHWCDQWEGKGRAVVIGGGFIGVEMAENLQRRGIQTTLVERKPHILAPFDADMAHVIEREMAEHGVRFILKDNVQAFDTKSTVLTIHLSSGKTVDADFAVLAAGIQPDTKFLRESGITMTERGYIEVDDHMRTNIPDVYAVGDAVQIMHLVSGEKTAIALAGPANHQARIAADNMAGYSDTYDGVQGTCILKAFDLTAAATGENQQSLTRRHIGYHVAKVYPNSHAGYYPGAANIALKIFFDDTGLILGAQAAGYDGVDKRIDVLAVMIRHKHTVHDLAELELAYAPPYSSAKDPVNIAGYMAENILDGLTDVISYGELDHMMTQGAMLIDVRTPDEYDNGHLPQAKNIPLDVLRDHLHELDQEKPLIVYCRVGQRGYLAERLLKQHGFTVKNLLGGYTSAKEHQFSPDKFTVPDHLVPPVKQTENQIPTDNVVEFDVTGLSCPGPLMKLREHMESLQDGTVAEFTASDPGFYNDSQSWCERTGNLLIRRIRKNGLISVWIQKNGKSPTAMVDENETAHSSAIAVPPKDNKTIIVFSGDLDKVLAAFVIANGALAMGKKVTMFFTFWGLNALRRPHAVSVKKGFIDAVFGRMLPRGSRQLKLSHMNMLGMGTKLMRKVMHDKNIQSLESLIASAQANGVHMIACQMSMDVMGIRQEELLDGVDVGGVATFLSAAEDSNMSLFI